jgi:hypothetical protein
MIIYVEQMTLNKDVIHEIFKYLHPLDVLYNASLVNKMFSTASINIIRNTRVNKKEKKKYTVYLLSTDLPETHESLVHMREYINDETRAISGNQSRINTWNEDTMRWLSECCYLDIIKYAHENGCPWSIFTTCIPAMDGRMDIIKYVHENGCPWNESTMEYAAVNGYLDIIKYAHENGCPWNESTMEYAAVNGYLDIIKYAHKHGCPWGKYAMGCAASNGQIRIIKYMYENGCPWDKHTARRAAINGYVHIIKYIHEHNLFIDVERCLLLTKDKDVIEYLKSL